MDSQPCDRPATQVATSWRGNMCVKGTDSNLCESNAFDVMSLSIC